MIDDATLARAVQALQQGQVVAYPTETVYGLGVDPFQEQAVRILLELKGRSLVKGLILLIPDLSWVACLACPSDLARSLMASFWPGPLTLVMPATPQVPTWITGESGLVALRLSPHPEVSQLLAAWHKPLVSTSANLAGEPDLRDHRGVVRQWGERVAVVLAGESGQSPSTVLQVMDHQITLLREGAIARYRLDPFLDFMTKK